MTYAAVQMKQARLELRITQDLLDAIDAARGDVSRTRWVERALESALSTTVGGVTASESPAGAGSASSRASVPVPGVRPARELLRDGVAMERQARVNALRSKKK